MATRPASARAAVNAADMEAHAQEAANLLRALASEHRLMVLCSLAEGEASVSELLERIPLGQSALSQHLAVLRRERLVSTRREGQAVFYSIQSGPALDVIRALYKDYCCQTAAGKKTRGA